MGDKCPVTGILCYRAFFYEILSLQQFFTHKIMIGLPVFVYIFLPYIIIVLLTQCYYWYIFVNYPYTCYIIDTITFYHKRLKQKPRSQKMKSFLHKQDKKNYQQNLHSIRTQKANFKKKTNLTFLWISEWYFSAFFFFKISLITTLKNELTSYQYRIELTGFSIHTWLKITGNYSDHQ